MGMETTITESMEDYLEAISVLGEKRKYVRVRDIAGHMEVSMPSVTGALKLLVKRDLVNHEKYEYVELTDQGMAVAQEVRRRHRGTLKFLKGVLRLDPETAERDACRMEHAISATTLDRLLKLVECLAECPRGTPECVKRFEQYVEHGEKPPIGHCERVSKQGNS